MQKGEKMRQKSKITPSEEDITKRLDELIQLYENSIIVNLALKNVPYKVIRQIIGCKMTRLTEFLKPIRKDIDGYIKASKLKGER